MFKRKTLKNFIKKQTSPYGFAFLVYPKDIKDVSLNYPMFKILPSVIASILLLHFRPIIASRVTGLKSGKTGRDLPGCAIFVPITTEQILHNRKRAVFLTTEAIRLAREKGASVVGLGAAISLLTKNELDAISKMGSQITAGYAYTAHIIAENLFKLTKIFGLDKTQTLVAIVGAASPMGANSALIVARERYEKFLLVDLQKKQPLLAVLSSDIKKLSPNAKVATTFDVSELKKADFIIKTVDANNITIKSKYVKSGAVVIEGTQPQDIASDIVLREDTLTVDAGVVRTYGIGSDFNLGLQDKNYNFCCFAEALISAHYELDNRNILNRATLEEIDKIASIGESLGFRPSSFRNSYGLISKKTFQKINNIIKNEKS